MVHKNGAIIASYRNKSQSLLGVRPLSQAIPSFTASRIELLETNTKKLEEKAHSGKLHQKCLRPNQSEKLELKKEARKKMIGAPSLQMIASQLFHAD